VVVNLTGRGQAERDHAWRGAGLRVLVEPREWNLAEVDAGQTLDEVEAGVAPVEALAWLPLMKRGGDPAIIRRWREVAAGEPDRTRRRELVLAQVFAELVGTQDVWIKALEGWEMIESPIIGKLLTEAEAKRAAEILLQMLSKRFKAVPDDLRAAILAVQDPERLTGWVDIALEKRSLRKFREATGL
jgi:hypothetical protein